MSKVVYVDKDEVKFDDGSQLYSYHDQDCCEHHYLDFSNVVDDLMGLDFDLSSDFFEKVEDFGIRLLPLNAHPVSVPGYGYNNGYYSSNLSLVLSRPGKETTFDITECQDLSDY